MIRWAAGPLSDRPNRPTLTDQRSSESADLRTADCEYGGVVKVTFSLDEATVAAIRRTAERLGSPQSQVIREAVAEYAARTDRVSERERLRTLGILDTLRQAPASRTAAAVDAELRAIRSARRSGGRRSAR